MEQQNLPTIDDKLLQQDPALKRVRRKLVALMLSSIFITFLLLGGVVAALIYKLWDSPRQTKISLTGARDPEQKIGLSADFDHHIPRDAGDRIVGHTLSDPLISLEILKTNGQKELLIYDYRRKEIIANIVISSQNNNR